MVVAQELEAEDVGIRLVATEHLEADFLTVRVTGSVIHSHIERGSQSGSDTIDAGQLFQFVHKRETGLIVGQLHTVYVDNVSRIIAERCLNHISHLQKHGKRGGNQTNGNSILKDDEKLAEHHLRLLTERTAYYFDRLGIGDHNGRQQSGDKASESDQEYHDHTVHRSKHIQQVNLPIQ